MSNFMSSSNILIFEIRAQRESQISDDVTRMLTNDFSGQNMMQSREREREHVLSLLSSSKLEVKKYKALSFVLCERQES